MPTGHSRRYAPRKLRRETQSPGKVTNRPPWSRPAAGELPLRAGGALTTLWSSGGRWLRRIASVVHRERQDEPLGSSLSKDGQRIAIPPVAVQPRRSQTRLGQHPRDHCANVAPRALHHQAAHPVRDTAAAEHRKQPARDARIRRGSRRSRRRPGAGGNVEEGVPPPSYEMKFTGLSPVALARIVRRTVPCVVPVGHRWSAVGPDLAGCHIKTPLIVNIIEPPSDVVATQIKSNMLGLPALVQEVFSPPRRI